MRAVEPSADAPHGLDRRAAVALVLATLVLLAGLALVLAQSGRMRTGTDGIQSMYPVGEASGGSTICRLDSLIPPRTGVVRTALATQDSSGPALRMTLRRNGQMLRRVSIAGGWSSGYVSARIAPTTRALDHVDVCFSIARGTSVVTIAGNLRPPLLGTTTVDGKPLQEAMVLDFLAPTRESWFARAATVATRMGMGRGSWSGGWMLWLCGALMVTSAVLAGRLALRTIVADRDATEQPRAGGAPARLLPARLHALRRRLPRGASTVVAIGVLNAAAWSLITPVFLVPDEVVHVAYVQQIGETGRPPVDKPTTVLAPELETALADVHVGSLFAGYDPPGLWQPSQQRRIDRDQGRALSRRGNDDADASDPEPPLYYAVEAVAYRIAHGAGLLNRIALMRLLSACFAGITALLLLLFVRECLPRHPWAWSVGGLSAAFVPLVGFISGGVNPDALVFAVSAALFYCIARAFRRGMTTQLAVWTGVVLALGAIGKINFYGLVPGALIALALAAHVHERAWNRQVGRLMAITLAIGAGPYLLMTALDVLVWNRSFILAGTPAIAPEEHGNLFGQLSYLWQFYLPRLPGQQDAFLNYSPTYDLWFESFIGKFGPQAVLFPAWGYQLARAILVALGLLAVRSLVVERAEARRRMPELLGYVCVAGGLLLLIGMVALRGFAPGPVAAGQGRYLLPLLALLAVVLALAARGAGARWGRAVGAVVVVAALAWTLFAQLLTIGYYYG